MIRLNGRDSATLAMIAQYQNLPPQRKQALVNRLSPVAKPIGLILIGGEPANTSEEVKVIAKRFTEWTTRNRNRKSRSSLRTISLPKRESVVAASN